MSEKNDYKMALFCTAPNKSWPCRKSSTAWTKTEQSSS